MRKTCLALLSLVLFGPATAAPASSAESPVPVTPKPPVVTGRVVDEEGKPLAGVEVWLRTNQGRQENPLPATVSGPDGTFSFFGLGLSSGSYLAACPAGRVEEVHFLVGDLARPIELRLRRATRISGRVLDPEGRPVPGALVSAQHAGWYDDQIITYCGGHPQYRIEGTDAAGRFDFDQLEPGWFEVRAADARPKVVRVRGDAGRRSDEIEFVLPSARVSLEGQVLDAAGQPVEGATVRVLGTVQTDATGAYRFTGLRPGKTLIQVRHPAAGWLDEEIELAGDTRHDLRLPPLAQVTGRITGSNGAPVTEPSLTFDFNSFEVDEDGRFQAAVPRGERQLRVETRDWVTVERRIVAGDEPLDLEIRLVHPGSITGRLTGLPPGEYGIIHLNDHLVNLLATPGTDAQGNYTFPWVVPGDWTLTASDVLGRTVEARIHVEEGGKAQAEDIRFPPLPAVRGRVLDAAGLPVAEVMLTFRQGAVEKKVWTGHHATFETGLTAGTWNVQAERPGSAPAFATLTVGDAPAEVPDLRLARPVTLTGRVHGLPPGDFPWCVWAESADGWKRLGRGDQEQRYFISDLGPGTWKVTAQGEDAKASAVVRILPDDTEVTVDLELEAPSSRSAVPVALQALRGQVEQGRGDNVEHEPDQD
ncbi:MAG TPA: carboxypeptidase regulatory-like domain-containing protein [Thermoanaerobaculia bacterium]|nr:carboxypeptidase regulatory-like domain-containing protein [Thermoanaerobaculia bacterium]